MKLKKGVGRPTNDHKYTCQDCGDTFPSSVMDNGIRRKLKGRKYCLDCSPWRGGNKKILQNYDGRNKICPVCNVPKPPEQYSYNGHYISKKTGLKTLRYAHECKDCQVSQCKIDKLIYKKLCVDYKGGKCEHCGYDESLAPFDFHHVDPNDKDFMISQVVALSRILKTRKLDRKTIQELDKCLLLCTNCHRLEHAKQSKKMERFVEFLAKNPDFKY